MSLLPGMCEVHLLILGDMSKPEESQVVASASPDLTPEGWRLLGQYILDTLAADRVSKIQVGEDENGAPTYTNVTPNPRKPL